MDLYLEKWVEKILLAEKRLFSKILEIFFQGFRGTPINDFSPVRIPGKRINDLPKRNCGPLTTNNNQHGTQQQTANL